MQTNFIAMIVAALVPMVLGFVWYNPKVFGNAWMQATGVTEESAKKANMPLVFGVSFLMSLMLAFVMNLIATHDAFVQNAMFYATNKTMIPEPGSDLAKWYEYFTTNLAASNHTFAHGSFHGMMIGGLFIALPIIVTGALYERRGWKYMAITVGYWVISLGLMGGIIASWR